MPELTWYVIYKTTHVETDQFYVGRHQTTDLNDGYQGSGVWVRSFEDTSVLVTEVIEYCENAEHLKEREQHYIDLWFDDPMCMNESRFSDGGVVKGSPAHAKLLKHWSDPENLAARSKQAVEQWSDPEILNKLVESWTIERRQNQSQLSSELWSSPQYREFRSLQTKEQWADPVKRSEILASQQASWTDERRKKMSESREGKSLPEKTIQAMKDSWTHERRSAMSNRMTNRYRDLAVRQAQSKAQSRNFYIITEITTGKQMPTHSLRAFAREHGLSSGALSMVATGKRGSHKGFACHKISKEEYQELVDQLATQDNSPS